MGTNHQLGPDELRWRCDESLFEFETTADLKEKREIIGQEEALEALETGLSIRKPGFNVYVAGLTGTGKMTTIKFILEKLKVANSRPNDKCYVYNFRMPDIPRIIQLPAGKGREFKKDMEGLVESLKTGITKAFESESYQESREEILSKARSKQEELIKPFQEKLQKEGLNIVQMQMGAMTGPVIAPVVDGKPVSVEEYMSMIDSGKVKDVDPEEFKRKYEQYTKELKEKLKETAHLEEETNSELEKLDRDYALFVANGLIENLKEKYDQEKLSLYFDQVKEHVIDNVNRFKQQKGQQQQQQLPIPGLAAARREDEFLEYQVNLLVDNSETEGVPIIIENSPTLHKLFGTIETSFSQTGQLSTNHMKIKAGSILRADGGYLVFNALDALTEPYVWKTLKRSLIGNVVEIPATGMIPFMTMSGLKPEAIQIDLKVLVVGDYSLYHLLHLHDKDFRKVFKIKSDFVPDMDKTPDHIHDYANFAHGLCSRENLLHLDREGLAALIEFGVEEAGRQKKMTTRFSEIADVIREADYLARKQSGDRISANHVEDTLKKRTKRVNQIEKYLNEFIEEGRIRIDTTGTQVGQVNGMALVHTGDYRFGKPVRITAEVSMGRSGVVSIERESKMSGSTHDKGVLTMLGYLRTKYAQEKPLTLSASIGFEQSYAQVDGDSASSAELYALLSSLARVPLKQSIAVTGSVDQKGCIQAIGEVNKKIEGFFNACKNNELNGKQGVIIPERNVGDLMLKKEIVEAVKDGKFRIHAISAIDEGLEILSGMESGTPDEQGIYPEGSFNRLVVDRVDSFAQGLKEYFAEAKPGGNGS